MIIKFMGLSFLLKITFFFWDEKLQLHLQVIGDCIGFCFVMNIEV